MNRTTLAVPDLRQEQRDLQDDREHRDRPVSGLVRLYWMLLGNALLMFCAYLVSQAESLLTGADLAYWLVAGSLVAVRYVDIRHLGGTTAECKPATMGHWKNYARGLLVVSVIVWLAAHGLGQLLQ